MTGKKKAPVAAGAKDYSRSYRSVVQASPAPAEGPGPAFWLKTSNYDGEETAFEREPDLPHLTVRVIDAADGQLVEETYTRSRKTRNEDGDADFRTPRPPASGGWKLHQWPDPETAGSSACWRRPISRGWRLLDDGKSRHSDGRVWGRPSPTHVEEKVLSTYHVIERPEGRRPVARKVRLIDTGTKAGLVEETRARPGVNLFELGLGWEATAEFDLPRSVVWRRPYVKNGGAS